MVVVVLFGNLLKRSFVDGRNTLFAWSHLLAPALRVQVPKYEVSTQSDRGCHKLRKFTSALAGLTSPGRAEESLHSSMRCLAPDHTLALG